MKNIAEAKRDRALARTVILGILAASDVGAAHAAKWALDNDWTVNWDSTVSYGLAVRASKPNCGFIGNDNGGCVGNAATPLQNKNPAVFSSNLDTLRINQDDGNLNYRRGQVVSSNAQFTTEVFVKGNDGWSGLLRGTINRDFAIDNTRRGLDPDARSFAVSNPRLLDAYVTKEFDIGKQQARVRIGNQVLNWGENLYIPGGINSINSIYMPSAHQPGTPLKNLFIPAPMVSASTSLARGLGLEGFYQWKWNGFKFDAPGSFFSTSDFLGRGARGLYIPSSVYGAPSGTVGDSGSTITGANPATGVPYNRPIGYNGLADPNANPLGVGNVIPRGPDSTPGGGQWGFALRYKLPESGDELGFYYFNYHDKVPSVAYRVVDTVANPFGWQANLDYGRKRDLFGASYNFQAGEWAIGTELSFRPRDRVLLDPTTVIDPANASYCNTLALSGGTPMPVGTNCRSWIDTQHWQAHFTGLHILSPSGSLGGILRALGATEGTIVAEAAFAYYPKLQLNAGMPYAVTADYTQPTKLSAGMVLAASLTYPNVFGTRASLLPDIAISQGVKGYSATALPGFIKGAGAAVIGATIDFKTKPESKMRIDYTRNWGGGNSNLMRDRDFVTLSFTSSF